MDGHGITQVAMQMAINPDDDHLNIKPLLHKRQVHPKNMGVIIQKFYK